jgi:hypothetical protein
MLTRHFKTLFTALFAGGLAYFEEGYSRGYGLSLEGASAADLVKSMQAKSESVAQKGKAA